MSVWLRLLCGLLCLNLGCAHDRPAPPIAPFQQFVSPNIDWSSVKRVVLMPLANQTAYPNVAAEMQRNLAAELQRAGRFDIAVATREDPGARALEIFAGGQFDEVELLRVAREYKAEAVLFGQVTQYHPYNPPRVGLSLLLISPAEGIVIASSDGLWDAREIGTAEQAKQHFKQSLNWPQSVVGADRVLESPDVFQRFVSFQVAQSLMPTAAPAVLPEVIGSQPFVLPASGEAPLNTIAPYSETPPPAPPAAPNFPNTP